MSYEFLHDVPIYLQIMDIFRAEILAGRLAPGDQLPSVRDVAMSYGVNPNTVQKAFLEMDRLALTRSERTSGRFVIASADAIDQLRQAESGDVLQAFIERMKSLGLSREETLKRIEKGWGNE